MIVAKLYNTLSRKKEEFVPIEEGKVKMYVCGPTVYNFIHIGNARPFIIFDTLRRYLEYRGYDVKYVQNFTDVDDKIIKRSHEENITPEEVASNYIKELLGKEMAFTVEKLNSMAEAGSSSKSAGSEDFAYVSQKVPSIMIALAAGQAEKGYSYPQHHPKVKFDEEALEYGSSIYAYVAMKWLMEH